MTDTASVLVVDDEAAMRRFVAANLRARGYEVLAAEDGESALKLLSQQPLDLVILDIMLPGIDGLEVLTRLRQDYQMPVIVLSARGREGDKVKALDLGADDYLTKPFGVAELVARVRAVLRRGGPAPSDATSAWVYRHQDLEVDLRNRQVRRGGADVALTPKEYEVLAYLARNAGRAITHRQILQTVWGSEYGSEADYVWTYVRRLRRKIEPDPEQPVSLLTEPGVGYRLAASTAEP